jgi:AcrR family transcriptional regulator
MSSGTPTRTERRRARTRESLVSAARGLIAENGVSGLRVGEITERADVALGSFYNHFESKDDVVEAIVSETVRAIAAANTPLIESVEDPAEAASVSYRRFVRLAGEDPELARLLVNLNRAEARSESMLVPEAQRTLERGVETGRFEISDTSVALTTIIGGAVAVIQGILEERLPADADIRAAEGVLRSLGVPPDEAREIAGRELPEVDTNEDRGEGKDG